MVRVPGLCAVPFGLLLLGCGGGGDDDSTSNTTSGLAGMYQTLTDTVAAPCEVAPMAVTNVDPPYFQIADKNAFGAAYIAVYPCTGSDPSTCDEFAIVDVAGPAGDGSYKSEATELSSDGSAAPTECDGTYSTGEIKKTTGGVTVTTTDKTGTLTGADLCKWQGDFSSQQTAAIKALPCTSQEMRTGARL
jgi:hypothetical protein